MHLTQQTQNRTQKPTEMDRVKYATSGDSEKQIKPQFHKYEKVDNNWEITEREEVRRPHKRGRTRNRM